MLTRNWWLGALMAGAGLFLAGSSRADDVHNLKLKPSTSTDITTADRAQPSENDIEEINLRYRLGYWRGTNNTGYIWRFPAWRAGYDAASGGMSGSYSSGGGESFGGQSYGGGQGYGGAQNYAVGQN